jgi:multidrug efflux pump subunit AcrA (membrane-fusion protein)
MRRFLTTLGIIAFVVLAGTAYLTYEHWISWFRSANGEQTAAAPLPPVESQSVRLSEQARKSLRLVSQPVRLQTYWRTATMPGTIVDRPGFSDRSVTAPVAGTVTEIHAYAGDTVRPGDRLMTLRLVSEYVQNAQSELFKTSRDRIINAEQVKRAEELLKTGTTPQSTQIELVNQGRRLAASVQALRHDLVTRGLTTEQVDGVQEGKFVTHVSVHAPVLPANPAVPAEKNGATLPPFGYEVQELKTDLGQQVQAGQSLALLANHQVLLIEGHAFKQEVRLIERAAREGWPAKVEFLAADAETWPVDEQMFVIRSLGNTVDPASRTVPFFLPLRNQSRSFERDGKQHLAWRYRPGQRVRLAVSVEKFDDVLVLPADAVARDGVEAFAFRQNGDLFDRKPVQILFEDRQSVVVANDGNLPPGVFVAQNGAAALNRALKVQNASGKAPAGHWHADGTFHAH